MNAVSVTVLLGNRVVYANVVCCYMLMMEMEAFPGMGQRLKQLKNHMEIEP